MARRIFSVFTVIVLLLGVTSVPRWIVENWGIPHAVELYFLALAGPLVAGALMTLAGYHGAPRHPVNRMYVGFAAGGVVGAVLVYATSFVATPGVLAVVGAPVLFLGVVGAAVLAFSASPWREFVSWWADDQQERQERQERQGGSTSSGRRPDDRPDGAEGAGVGPATGDGA
ncbi:hypothetical protein QDW14_07930 [Corynebacterium bovis]|uniref:hypothetical protein n=1 Tax=Corynebacterium bovis TaxID=36808 RepID=UPI002446EA04|nr:hypothetical protein [Corynebacterium bovis]MDH2456399.1 hypothetical protein [Corynebacterium bovis]